MGITLQQFETMCQNRHLYTGYVEDLGYVYWKPRYVILSDHTSSRVSVPFYEMDLIVNGEYADRKLRKLDNIRKAGQSALSLYGIVNSFEQLSQTPVIIGDKYIQINKQGTLIHNPNKVYTTKGKIANGVGRRILVAGAIIDAFLWIGGRQSFSESLENVGVNTGIYMVGQCYPPAGIVLGILWFINSSIKPTYRSEPNYKEVHGYITPIDATRVDKSLYFEPIKYQPNFRPSPIHK